MYCDNHAKYLNTLCGQNEAVMCVKEAHTIIIIIYLTANGLSLSGSDYYVCTYKDPRDLFRGGGAT